jgi:hypothetical protein
MQQQQIVDYRERIETAYREFNDRHIDAVLALMRPDVDWPNGMEGGRVYGHEGVRAYWIRQWALVDPHVEPIEIDTSRPDVIAVKVHQVVRDIEGNLLSDSIVNHMYRFSGGLIARMDIE